MGICASTGTDNSETQHIKSSGAAGGRSESEAEKREKMLAAAEKRKEVIESKRGKLAPLSSSAKLYSSGGTGQGGDLKVRFVASHLARFDSINFVI